MTNAQLCILALQVADFPVAVARARTPALRGRPVIMVSSRRTMGRVVAVSPEARQAGVREGMRYPVARHLCPDAAVRTPDRDQEVRAEHAILTAALQVSPCLQRVGAGRVVVDLAGTRRLWGAPMDAASRLQADVARSCTLPSALGISSRTVWSRLAAQAVAPTGILEVLPRRETDFLSLVSPEWVAGIDAKTVELLRDMNIANLAMLRQFTPQEMLRVLGPAGRRLLEAVRVGDEEPRLRPVEDVRALLPLIEDAVDAAVDLVEESTAPDALCGALAHAVAVCGARLRAQRRICSRVRITVGYSDGQRRTGARALPEATMVDSELCRAAQQAFARAHTRRVRVCRIGLRCEGLLDAEVQTSLCQRLAHARELRRLAAIDAVRVRYGEDAIMSGTQYLAHAS